MSIAELKKAIVEKVDTLSEEQLIELDQFVSKLDKSSSNKYDLLSHLDDIIEERKDVLKKLAQ